MHDTILLHRLERLERAQRRWRGIAAASLFLGLCALSAGWRNAPDELEASRFVLRGDGGAEAAVLGLDAQGRPSLLLRDGKALAFLTLSGPGLLLRGDDGKNGAFLGFDTQNAAQLNLSSSRGNDGLRLEVQPDGSASFAALDQDGRERIALGFAAGDGTAALTTKDASGRVRTSLGLTDGDKPGLVLLDERGMRRIGMLVDPTQEGVPILGLLDERGRARVELTTALDGEPTFALRRSDGEPSFRAP